MFAYPSPELENAFTFDIIMRLYEFQAVCKKIPTVY